MGQTPVIDEEIVRYYAGDALVFEWRCTPVDMEALVVGRLYSEKLILEHGALGVERSAEGVLIRGSELPRPDTPRTRARDSEMPSNEVFTELFRAVFTSVDERYADGGMHAAALVRDHTILYQAEDVGRHNAVDKVIGKAVLAGDNIAALGMLVTSRVSGEIARKCGESGIAWLASRSIPTTLAVRNAQKAGMPIIGRAASKTPYVYR